MQLPEIRPDRFKRLFLNNKFVLFLLTLLLIGLNIFVLNKIPFVFKPFIVLVKTVLLPLILTGVVYYLLNPIVDLLERKHMKRIYSIISLYILILAVITLLILAVIPVIHTQIMELVHNFPAYSEQVQLNFESWIGNDIFNQIQQTTGFNPSDWTQTITQRLSSIVSLAGASIGSFIGFITETLLAIAVVPFILFYLLKGGKRLPDYILSFLPNSFRNQTFEVMSEMNHQISTYIRGQIIVSFCIGFLLYIGYLIIGLKYSLILAIIAAFTSVVPYLGPAIAITPALIVAAVTSPVMLLKMIVIWTIVQLIEGKFISRKLWAKH